MKDIQHLVSNVKMIKVLNKTIKYYSKDLSRRSQEPSGICNYYMIEDGVVKRDSIGRLCSKKNAKKLQENCLDASVEFININWENEKLADYLKPKHKDLPVKFLIDLQDLHDRSCYWEESGLSEMGKLFEIEMREKIIDNQYN